MDSTGYACEVAMRLIEIDYHKSFIEILANPDFASEFDRLAELYGPKQHRASSLEYRIAALEIYDRSRSAAKPASKDLQTWIAEHKKLPQLMLDQNPWHLDFSGVYILFAGEHPIYVGESSNMRCQIESILENESWRKLHIDRVEFAATEGSISQRYKIKAILAQHHQPSLNSPSLLAPPDTSTPIHAKRSK